MAIHTLFLGGGFGRKSEQDFVIDAVVLSRATGKPVKVVWSREDDVRHDKMRPLTAQFLQAGTDAAGALVAWRQRLVAASVLARLDLKRYEFLRGKDELVVDQVPLVYPVASQHREFLREDRGYDVGTWRAVGDGYTKFAIESFVDEIAHGHGVDPLAYRLRLLAGNPRARRVLDAVATMAQWGRTRPYRGLGIALSYGFDIHHIAAAAEVSVDRASGRIRVHSIWCAADIGVVIHRDNAIAQIEGAAVMGVSHALGERITVRDGIVQQSNFHDYPILRLADTPVVHVQLLPSDGHPYGVGEYPLSAMAPAIANAVAQLTGARVRQLPLTPERVLAALAHSRTKARER